MDELIMLLNELKNSDDKYLQNCGKNIEECIANFENGSIPEPLCRSYLQDIRDLIELDRLRYKIKNLALAQKIIDHISIMISNGIANFIKKI